MALESSGQDLGINQLNMVRSTVMIDNDTNKQREKKKKKDEEPPTDKVELSTSTLQKTETAPEDSNVPEEKPSADLISGVKIDILAR